MRLRSLLTAKTLMTLAVSQAIGETTAPPQWAVRYTEGLSAWRDLIYYWIDRQKVNGSFGFGWGEDEEMVVGWPGVMMAADDRRIQTALERMIENVWYNDNIQNGYVWLATDAEHGPEPTSYGTPILLYQDFGSPKLIERLMITARNVEQWTALTPRGDRHMRSTYFGAQQLYDWPFYDEDSPINARAWIPMMQLVLYNRDPHLLKYYLEWADAWAKHAMEDVYGKPPGIMPGQVAFPTGEPGGHTQNWWGAGAHDFSSLWYQTRMHEVLAIAYAITGEDQYIRPMREMLRFFSSYARPMAKPGEPLPPDRLPAQYKFPPGWREGTESTRWARDVVFGHFGGWYYYLTGDTQFDAAFSDLLGQKIERGPFARIDQRIVDEGWRRAVSFRDKYFTETVPKLQFADSLANYAAAWWQKQYGTMTFGQRCFRDGGHRANAVNWPWVDFPPPSVVWKDTGYETAIFILDDSPQRLRAALCNLGADGRRIGMQVFTLDEGAYSLRLGSDVDEDGVFDAVTTIRPVEVERGTKIGFTLPKDVTMLLELARKPDSGPVPPWRPRPDVGLDAWDIMISKSKPPAGESVTLTIRVHNIGSRPAEKVKVRLLGRGDSGETPLGEAALDHLNPPKALIPSFADVKLPWIVAEGVREIGVRLDPEDTVDELYEGNNEAWAALADLATSQREKKYVAHEPATRPSLTNVKAENQSRYDVPFRADIQLDGVIGEQEWGGAPEFAFIPHGKEPLKKRTWMRVAYDERALYLGLRCEEPDMQWLDTDLPRMEDIYYKDGFEIFLDPGAQVWRYWQFCFDTVPHMFQTLSRNQFARKAVWEVKVHKGDKDWSAEVRFLFSEFDVPPPKAGDRWRMNVMRYTTTFRDPQHPQAKISERSHFSPQGRLHGHHTPELFGDLYFGTEPE